MKQLHTRQQKVKFLQDLHTGKARLQDALAPVCGVIFIRSGKVFAREDKSDYKALEAEIDTEAYAAQHSGTYSHVVELVDFSQAK
jgi:hypothetical protein